jgi:hypothetical protein
VMACGNMVELVDFLDGVREREGGVRRDG